MDYIDFCKDCNPSKKSICAIRVREGPICIMVSAQRQGSILPLWAHRNQINELKWFMHNPVRQRTDLINADVYDIVFQKREIIIRY